jgi:hypothetical protein
VACPCSQPPPSLRPVLASTRNHRRSPLNSGPRRGPKPARFGKAAGAGEGEARAAGPQGMVAVFAPTGVATGVARAHGARDRDGRKVGP